tara:strand:+ start:5641 stop:6852 length:1212 start_codon:yes stop_codon:yes gene_type:complete
MKQNYDIIIIGAGISGLTCAQKFNENNKDFLLIEKSNRIGGRVGSLKSERFIFDLGFQVYNTAYKTTNRLLQNKSEEYLPFMPGAKIMIKDSSTIISDPIRNFSKILNTFFSTAASLSDKIKILILKNHLSNYSIELDDSEDMQTIDYLRWYGFSEKIIDNFFNPFFSGIFLEDRLETSSKFFKYVFSNFNNGLAVLPKNGMQEIPNQIFSNIDSSHLLLNTVADKILPGNKLELSNGRTILFNHLILTNESCTLAGQPSIKYNSVSTVYISSNRSFRDSSYIHLFPQDDIINNVAFVSSVSPNYAPKDKTLLSISILGKNEIIGIDKKLKQKMVFYFGGDISDYKVEKIMNTKKATLNQLPGFYKNKIKHEGNIIFAGDHMKNGSIEGAAISGIKAYERTIK